MRHPREASILPFPAHGPAGTARPIDPGRHVVLQLPVPKKGPEQTASANATWDELTRLVLEAWCWRDPESLARLEACVGRLWLEVDREWS
jgi:hypothetical protein